MHEKSGSQNIAVLKANPRYRCRKTLLDQIIFQVNVAISDGKGGITFCRTSARECGRFSILGRGSTSAAAIFPQQLTAFHNEGAFVYLGNTVYLFGGKDAGTNYILTG